MLHIRREIQLPREDSLALKQFANFIFDTANECLWREGAQIGLQPKPFAVLRYMVENPGRLITHDELLDALWPDTFVQPQVLRTYVLELRKILGDDAGRPRFIQTLPKRGYRFVAGVEERPDDPPAAGAEWANPAFTGLVGRELEMARLYAELEAASAGGRRVVLLCGEAGIGKTALIDALARQAAASAIRARGQCVPGGGEESFYPIMEALGHLCASADGEAACRTLARMAPAWLAALGRQEARAEAPAPAADQERMPGKLCAALEEISVARPLVLAIEDLQWADGATLKLLAALARRRSAARLLIVASCRPRSVSADHPLKPLRQELLLQRLCTEITLRPLPRAAILSLIARELASTELPTSLGAFVYRHSEGNPLFALVILRHLMTQELLVCSQQDGGSHWELAADCEEQAGVPDELAQMVELEIERLSEQEQRIVEAGSLMQVAFPAWAVAAALEEEALEIEEACAALARKCHFLQRAGEDELPDGTRAGFYAFTHGLYREVLYLRQAASRRALGHTRIAGRLSELFAGREAHVAREMAMHYEAAGDWRMGAQALRAAAQYAGERRAYAEAEDLLERALRMAGNRAGATDEPRAIRGALHEVRAALRTLENPRGSTRKARQSFTNS